MLVNASQPMSICMDFALGKIKQSKEKNIPKHIQRYNTKGYETLCLQEPMQGLAKNLLGEWQPKLPVYFEVQ